VIVLYGTNEKGETVDGLSLAKDLKKRLAQDVGLLAFPVLSIDTVLCLDPCSGKEDTVNCDSGHKKSMFIVCVAVTAKACV
jgi:hypothetical protein